jgi:8-oxo-dGTP pyrophosphatase MutT (NUDIX family)
MQEYTMKESVAGIIFKDGKRGGKIFIARRVGGGEMDGVWELPGGKVEFRKADDSDESDASVEVLESHEAALIREFDEELGLQVRVGSFLAKSEFEHKGITRTLYGYELFSSEADIRAICLREHSRWQWASIEEIKKMNFTPSDMRLLSTIET